MDEYLNFINELNEEELKIFVFRILFKLNGSKIAKLTKISQRRSYKLCKNIENHLYFNPIKKKLLEYYEDANGNMV